jgi:hypothetical protein
MAGIVGRASEARIFAGSDCRNVKATKAPLPVEPYQDARTSPTREPSQNRRALMKLQVSALALAAAALIVGQVGLAAAQGGGGGGGGGGPGGAGAGGASSGAGGGGSSTIAAERVRAPQPEELTRVLEAAAREDDPPTPAGQLTPTLIGRPSGRAVCPGIAQSADHSGS